MTDLGVIFAIGALFLFVTFIIGTLEIFHVKIPSLPRQTKPVSFVIGVFILVFASWLMLYDRGVFSNNNTSVTDISSIPSDTLPTTPDKEDNVVTESLASPSPTDSSISESIVINTPSSPTSTPTTQITPTQEPSPSATPTQQPVISFCPVYEETGVGTTQTIDILVDDGQIAFINAFSFDNMSGGVFVKITGYYSASHMVHDGAICGGIPANANYAPIEQQRRDSQDVRTWDIELP